jgi:hypothetical protein
LFRRITNGVGTVANDNVNVTFTLPSPSVNYVQHDGIALSGTKVTR